MSRGLCPKGLLWPSQALTPFVESLVLDETFPDVTGNDRPDGYKGPNANRCIRRPLKTPDNSRRIS